jgi:hypothetical protein
MTLYSLTKLEDEVTLLKSIKQFDQMEVLIKVKHTNEVLSNSSEGIRMFNIIFKR